MPCDQCRGRRYKEDTLAVRYKGKNINDVLEMPVAEAYEFFKPIPKIATKLKAMVDVGLGYIHLGQSAVTLSGGESQRMKLASELSRPSTGRTPNPRRASISRTSRCSSACWTASWRPATP